MLKSNIAYLLKNYRFYKSRSLFIEKELHISNQEDDTITQINNDMVSRLEMELFQLRRKIETIETCLKMAGEYDERYKIIIESHFFNNVRIEDIADMTHISRSRCYELCNEAVSYISRIIFGEDQRENVI